MPLLVMVTTWLAVVDCPCVLLKFRVRPETAIIGTPAGGCGWTVSCTATDWVLWPVKKAMMAL